MENGYTDKTIGEVIDKSFDAGFKAAVDKACNWLNSRIDVYKDIKTDRHGNPKAKSYLEYTTRRLEVANKIVEEFKEYMNS